MSYLVMYFDAHTHLNDDILFPQWERIVHDCIAQNIAGLTVVWVDTTTNERACMIASQTKQPNITINATVWLHPSLVSYNEITNKHAIQKNMERLEWLLDKESQYIVAIGECWIDAHYEGYTHHKWLQQDLLYAQCLLAKERWLPIVIHSRDQFDDTIAVLREFSELKMYFHCRSYTLDDAMKLETIFPHLRIGFCGNITYPKAVDIRKTAVHLLTNPEAKARVLFETDAPYLSPQSRRGTHNTPLNVPLIYDFCSSEFDLEMQMLQENIAHNRELLFMSSDLQEVRRHFS